MNTSDLRELGFSEISHPREREILGGFCGDLLSWVMGRAEEGDLWFTIMGNMNTIAVASLADVSAVVLCEGVTAGEDVVNRAKEEEINIFSTDLPMFEAATKFYEFYKNER
jgi:predicted transcriptional regulator